jgi:steroid 5-alpha reductase family enzyme
MQRSYTLVVAAYAVALLAAWLAAELGPFSHPVAVAAWADVVATVAVFAFSYAFGNSSFYDPYWSVAPLPIALYWAACAPSGLNRTRVAIVILLIAAWGARLTRNWVRGWQGLHHEDWRYIDLKTRTGGAYWAVSFAGIHMFPTVVVFLGCLAVWSVAGSDRPLGVIDLLAAIVTAGAIGIEARADVELHRFRSANRQPGAILDSGLWALSRHPNYFGEMSFWWGLWLFGVAASPRDFWWTAIGPVTITLMFRLVSLPMMEERMTSRRPGYALHAARTPLVIPWPRRP